MFRRNFIKKPGRFRIAALPVEHAVRTPADSEFLAGTRHRDVHQAPFFPDRFVFVFVTTGRVREKSLFQTAQENHGEFEAL